MILDPPKRIFSIGYPNPRKNESKPSNSFESSTMEAQPDFRELLGLFNAHGVKYIIAGAYALAFHGVPRNTGDIDLLVQPTVENADRILEALKEFGFGSLGLKREDFEKPDCVVQLGVPPVRVDIITSLTGISWDQADAGKAKGLYGDIPAHYLGRIQFVENKRAIGRKKDQADLEALDEK